MTLEFKPFNSRLGRRIFATFIACALIPVVTLSALSLFQVTDQLQTQAYQHLRQATKSHGLSIYEHLLFCEEELELADDHTTGDADHLLEKFSALGHRFPDGRYETVFGDPIPVMVLNPEEEAHIDRGKTLLRVTGTNGPAVVLLRRIASGVGSPALLAGMVNPAYLWGLAKGNSLPPSPSLPC